MAKIKVKQCYGHGVRWERNYCGMCGAPLVEVEVEMPDFLQNTATISRTCNNCNSRLEFGSINHCGNCGVNLTPELVEVKVLEI